MLQRLRGVIPEIVTANGHSRIPVFKGFSHTKANVVSMPEIAGYEIKRLIARGSMGRVYEAVETRLRRTVAVKLLTDPSDPELATRFEAEARAVAGLSHPNIARLFTFSRTQNGELFLAMEYVSGGTLSDAIKGRILPWKTSARLVITLAEAVHAAHTSGIIHRDLKPGNILIAQDAASGRPGPQGQTAVNSKAVPEQIEGDLVGPHDQTGDVARVTISPSSLRIADFGLARHMASDARMTRTGQIVGTPPYMPPEQASGITTRPGPGVDIYSLGAILYELLVGRPPFLGADTMETIVRLLSEEPADPCSLQPNVPIDLQTICLKCLQKKPSRRYATAQDLADDLQRFLDNRPILARPVSTAAKIWKWVVRNPWKSVAASGLLIAGIGAFASFIMIRTAYREVTAANEKLTQTVHESDVAYRLSQETLERIVNRVRDDLVEVPQATQLMLQTSRDSVDLLQKLHDLRPEDLAVSRNLVNSLTTLANVEWIYGTHERSIEASRQLDVAIEKSLQRHPEDLELQISLLKFLMDRVQFPLADSTAETNRQFRKKLEALFQQLLAAHPDQPDILQQAVLMAQLRMNEARKAGDPADFLKIGHERIDWAKKYHDASSGEVRDTAAMWHVQALRVVGEALLVEQRPSEAETYFRTALEIFDKHPSAASTREFRYRKALMQLGLAKTRKAQNDRGSAATLVDQSLQSFRSLVADFPDDDTYRVFLARACLQSVEVVGASLENSNAAELTESLLVEAANHTAEVLKQNPEDPDALELTQIIADLRLSQTLPNPD